MKGLSDCAVCDAVYAGKECPVCKQIKDDLDHINKERRRREFIEVAKILLPIEYGQSTDLSTERGMEIVGAYTENILSAADAFATKTEEEGK